MSDDIDTKYTAICSAQTIFSNDKGFFGELFESVKAKCTDQWIEKMFNSSMNDIDKLKVLYNEPNVSDVLLGMLEHVSPIYTKKDAAFSRQRCEAGKQLMATKDFEKALIILSQAVLRAPHKGRYGWTIVKWRRQRCSMLKWNWRAEAMTRVKKWMNCELEIYNYCPDFLRQWREFFENSDWQWCFLVNKLSNEMLLIMMTLIYSM